MHDARNRAWMKQLEREYAKKAARRTAAVRAAQAALLAAFVGLWEAAGRFGWIDELLFSYPTKIAAQLGKKIGRASCRERV